MARRHMRGLNLVEVVVTLAVASILTASAVPTFAEMMRRARTNSVVADLRSDLLFARSEAAKRNQGVIACAASVTAGTCAGGTDWAGGWLVCTDANNDLACDPSSDLAPNPLRVHPAIPGTLTLTAPANPIRFNGTGESAAVSAFTVKGTWTGATARTIRVEPSGLVRG